MAIFIKQLFSAENQKFIEKLEKLNLELIAFKLMHPDSGFAWTRELTDYAISRYKMFLFLSYKYPHCQLVPTQEIDIVWHEHILDTRKYAEDCQELFGRLIHHYPYFGLRSEEDRQNWETAFAQTKALFDQHFGSSFLKDNHSYKSTDVEKCECKLVPSIETLDSQKFSYCVLP